MEAVASVEYKVNLVDRVVSRFISIHMEESPAKVRQPRKWLSAQTAPRISNSTLGVTSLSWSAWIALISFTKLFYMISM